ncbi:MAG: DUF2254 domain-containing protein [Xanthobacteraceae bacterium]|nr:DUF2254 domain-containing protein [Xanthobacteraceae bacterium]
MKWGLWYRIRSYTKSSLWIVPFIAIPLEMVAIRVVDRIAPMMGWLFLGLGAQAARTMLETVVTASLSFLVFTFGSLLVAIQVAGGQLTPRIIATTLLRDNVVRYTVGLFIFTLLFALGAGNRLESSGHQFVIFVAALLGISCFAAFLYLIDYAARLLRPITILTRVASDGLGVIRAVYPEPTRGRDVPVQQRAGLGPPGRTVLHQGTSEIVVAVNVSSLMAQAEASGGVIEFGPQVGDFVAMDEPLFQLYGAADKLADADLVDTVAFGAERTMEQDPTFAFRIVIDIALRALSPAINDPTTAVLAIDQVHRLLRLVGQRDLRTDEILDRSDRLRVVVRTPNWDDFVNLAITEIRMCGASNMQVVRRLRAMIENLMQTLPAHRHAELERQLSLLERDVRKHYSYPEDLVLAGVADVQGLGGRSGQ